LYRAEFAAPAACEMFPKGTGIFRSIFGLNMDLKAGVLTLMKDYGIVFEENRGKILFLQFN
jgi:hypothetical protein